VHDEVAAMRNVAVRWRRPAVARQPEVVADRERTSSRAKSGCRRVRMEAGNHPAGGALPALRTSAGAETSAGHGPVVKGPVIADVLAVTYVVTLDGERADFRQEFVRVRSGESFQGAVVTS
jgi:hypothetical protein